MKQVEPKIFHLAGTEINPEQTQALLREIGAENWSTNTFNGPQMLLEIAGKFCYKSFRAEMNPNLTAVRDANNQAYLANILKSGHGSVLEHAYDTYAIVNVSRVFTHELVRHRLANYSQESLRFVRLTDINYYYPDAFRKETLFELQKELRKHGKELPDVNGSAHRLRAYFTNVIEYLESVQAFITQELKLDELPSGFSIKKKITSAMRRLAPIGLATGIIVTTNHRNWRHLIALRTAEGAEEEIRKVFLLLAKDLYTRYPHIYQDMVIGENGTVTFEFGRV